jgi:hypothetical protein
MEHVKLSIVLCEYYHIFCNKENTRHMHIHLSLFNGLCNKLFFSWKEKQIFAWHIFYCFHSFIKWIEQWKIKYFISNRSVVKCRFYVPKFWVFCNLMHFLYSPIPLSRRTVFPGFYTSLENVDNGPGGGGRSLCKLPGLTYLLWSFCLPW